VRFKIDEVLQPLAAYFIDPAQMAGLVASL
jgi:hypothetical protein